jgi:hypothetical protein
MSEVSFADASNYPRSLVLGGEEYFLISENAWLRRLATKDQKKFSVHSRLRDGSFDETLLQTTVIEDMTERERDDAALALKVSDRKDLPQRWLDLIASVKRFT